MLKTPYNQLKYMKERDYYSYLKEKSSYIGITYEEHLELIEKNGETLEEHRIRLSNLEDICNDCNWD